MEDKSKKNSEKEKNEKDEQTAPLDQCQISETAEHSRLSDDNEPCDDGRAG